MRLKTADLTTIYLREPINGQDDEGNIIKNGWGNSTTIKMNVQSAGGTVNAQIWGKDLKYIKSCKYQGNLINEGQQENWGICLHVAKDAEPDYLINSIQTFSDHKNITLEKRNKGSDSNG
ncbi:hypothetical protein KBX49_11130 [Liquorilactobacillus satsumensis]|uniref:hypothetical protein n=1 Tax=Liquorilactobacillus satsumensis TaxID=259059 RepID=UPI0021C288BB|nr:hypothetical protein [Liquorilactobacillus satsumensis]MCP9358510.1 hypothetical protein [Liquorilactobacillus satsumensis]MCP9372464.1 hypothetical protein [Liquorilactobacillus satsumensis]